MNKQRRKDIDKAIELLEEAARILESAGEEEQDYADNMPENMHYSEKHGRAEEVASELTELEQEISELVTRAEECKESY